MLFLGFYFNLIFQDEVVTRHFESRLVRIQHIRIQQDPFVRGHGVALNLHPA